MAFDLFLCKRRKNLDKSSSFTDSDWLTQYFFSFSTCVIKVSSIDMYYDTRHTHAQIGSSKLLLVPFQNCLAFPRRMTMNMSRCRLFSNLLNEWWIEAGYLFVKHVTGRDANLYLSVPRREKREEREMKGGGAISWQWSDTRVEAGEEKRARRTEKRERNGDGERPYGRDQS